MNLDEDVLIAIIITLPAIISAAIAVRANHNAKQARRYSASAKESSESANEQVSNGHSSNLREDQDEKHRIVMDWLQRVDRSVGGIRDDNRELGRRLTTLETIHLTRKERRQVRKLL